MTNFLDAIGHVVDGIQQTSNLPEGKLGDVVIAPGILGSNLSDEGGVQVWPSPDITLNRLRFPSDQDDHLLPSGLHSVYRPLRETLEQHWRVHEFPYDWRDNIARSADALRSFIHDRVGTGKVHIVAHSMGGLVARIALHNEPTLLGGGHLVMLGTPNHGSIIALLALTSQLGASAFFKLLASLTPKVNAMAIADTWPGFYELMPCPFHDPSFHDFYSEPPAVLNVNFTRAAEDFHRLLDGLPTPNGAVYIGGTNLPTADGSALPANGDGVVSHNRGLLRDTITFLVPGDHATLPANIIIRTALTPLLHTGTAAILAPFRHPSPSV